jgi:hypothetical protein
MSFRNPTPLQVGMSGLFSGQRFQIIGRVVLGIEEGGEVYLWNEFNLQGQSGESATLVYEQTERGGEWRWFTMFEPEYPITAQDAATKRPGDPLNLDGTDVRVSLLEESRVYEIEGQAPEGVEVGDVARYFNAEAGSAMYVVSWTGDEVEVFRGATIPREVVAVGFNLKDTALRSFLSGGGAKTASSKVVTRIVLLIAATGVGAAIFFASVSTRRGVAVTKLSAPASPFKVGWSGRLLDRPLKIAGHATVQVSEVGVIFERHEFDLRDEEGKEALLIQGWAPDTKDWALFTPLQPAESLRPTDAAALSWGQTVNVDGVEARISQLFHAVARPDSANQPELETVGDLYGFVAQSDTTLLMARWNSNSIAFYKGKILPSKEAAAAFKPAP